MDLQQQAKIVSSIRTKMQESIGQRLFVRVNLGRSRINENTGTLVQAHPSVFICDLEYRRGRVAKQSFQYADILTGVVEVYQHHKPMFGPFNIEPDAPLVEPSKQPKVKKRLRPSKPLEQRIRLNSTQVAMLAERMKAEANRNGTTNRSSKNKEIVMELSKKFDEKRKAEEAKQDTEE
ncbi:MAG: Veg family protein [Coriobacteriia bacterium]|nr:Veg family protein [Coriobacteriia bacterium]